MRGRGTVPDVVKVENTLRGVFFALLMAFIPQPLQGVMQTIG